MQNEEATPVRENHGQQSFVSRLSEPDQRPERGRGHCLWDYQTLDDVLTRIPYFMEDVYNRKWLHASLGYMTPNKFEAGSETLTE